MYETEKLAHMLIEEQAGRSPDASAISFEGKEVSYAEMNAAANRLAERLREHGVGSEVNVGIFLERSPQAVIALLGVLKAGGSYVPLDPAYPRMALESVVHTANIRIILTGAAQPHFSPDTLELHVEDLIRPISFSPGSSYDYPNSSEQKGMPDLESAAYICSTSGSTGVPKLIVHTHRHLLHYRPPMDNTDVCALNASLSFGFSVARIFPVLFRGAKLAIISDRELREAGGMLKFFRAENVTMASLVPSALRLLLDQEAVHRRGLPRLSSITISGASLDSELVERFKEILPSVKIFYGYGSSETGPATLREVTRDDDSDSQHVGWPLPNTVIHVVDKDLNTAPRGMVGEICVSSRHLARGYLDNPKLSRERFIPCPFEGNDSDIRMFRTGDLGRYLADGQLELVGRSDTLVKIRGFRVELGEIDRALLNLDCVLEAAVCAQEAGGENRLVAYIVFKAGVAPVPSQLRAVLRTWIPDHMLPAVFVKMDRFPLGPNGKVDKHALPIPNPVRPDLDVPLEVPRNSSEAALARIWEAVIGIDGIGIHDDFHDLGVDSLMLTRIAARILEEFDTEVSLGILFERPTIAELAAAIDNR